MFDGGAPGVDLMLRNVKDLTRVKAFFNTHFHGDHITGALNMLSLFEWFYKDTDLDVYLPDEGSKQAVVAYLAAVDEVQLPSERVRMQVYGEGLIYEDGVIRVTAIPVNHCLKPGKKSFAFLIEAEGKRILYTGDMSASLADFPQIAYECELDMILSEAAHCSAQDLMNCMDRVNTSVFAVTHIWPLSKINELEQASARYPFPIHIARDGDVFIL